MYGGAGAMESAVSGKVPGMDRAVGDIEALNSLATFAFNHPGYIYPVAGEGEVDESAGGTEGRGLFIEATAGHH